MRIVLAIEGADGSGKSSLATFLMKLCRQRGQPFTLVGRREGTANALIGKLSRMLNEEGKGFTPQGAILVRLAREYQRAQLAASVPSGLVVLDRFVLSLLALVRLNGLDTAPFQTMLRDVVARAHLHATVFVTCPFEIARQRVEEREAAAGGNGKTSVQLLQQLARFQEEDFRAGTLTGQQWLVDNSGAAGAAEEQLEDYLASLLREGRPAGLASGTDLKPAVAPGADDEPAEPDGPEDAPSPPDEVAEPAV
jgi:thymidylate kinase